MQSLISRLGALLFLLPFLPLLLNAQGEANSKIDPVLWEKSRSFPTQYFQILILLSDRVDVQAVDQSLVGSSMPQERRTRALLTSLREKAAATQPELLRFLNQLPELRKGSAHGYWATNLIEAEIQGSALEKLARRSDIGWIEAYRPLQPLRELRGAAAPLPAPNRREPGLSAINAPAMWALGYTGYGRKAFIFDTGVDRDHPALKSSFYYHNTDLERSWFGTREQPFYCGSHGTHVTGTTLGIDRQTNDTIGVAFNARWLATATLTTCEERASREFAIYDWVLDPDGDPTTIDDIPDVINYSAGREMSFSDCLSRAYRQITETFEAAGIAVIYAAGNSGPDSLSISAPAGFNWGPVSTFAVGAINGNVSSLLIAPFSSRGRSICTADGEVAIKPEVVAPGVGVRSSVAEGGYAFYDGTSMAAPHVSGAILLLREAFPYLSANELKLALYQTARDLGEPGEDNVFGRGLIDVFAAYQYLVAQGNVPAPPVSAHHDVVILDVSTSRSLFCYGDIVPTVKLENAGRDTLRRLTLRYRLNGTSVERVYTWEGALAPDQIAGLALPPLQVSVAGSYELEVDLERPNGQVDFRDLNNRFKLELRVAPAEYLPLDRPRNLPDTICAGSRILLSSRSPQGQSLWFDQPAGGRLLFSGDSLFTGPINQSTTFYLDRGVGFPVGKPDLGTDAYLQNSEPGNGLVFDCYRTIILRSVKVFAQSPGGQVIRLLNSEGIVLYQRNVRLARAGEQRINLDFEIPAGEDYRLDVNLGRPLALSTSGVQFPYAISGVIAIKGSTREELPQSRYYYYFFDWEIEALHPCGRTEVPVVVRAGSKAPQVGFVLSSDTLFLRQGAMLTLTDTTADVERRVWDFGDGNTGLDAQEVQHQYLQSGLFQVSLEVTDSKGCSNFIRRPVLVLDGTVSVAPLAEAALGLKLFPNPSSGLLRVDLEKNLARPEFFLVDALGRSLGVLKAESIGAGSYELNLTTFANGLYFLQIRTAEGRFFSNRFVLSR